MRHETDAALIDARRPVVTPLLRGWRSYGGARGAAGVLGSAAGTSASAGVALTLADAILWKIFQYTKKPYM